MKLKERLAEIKRIEDAHSLPFEVYRIFGKSSLFGSQIVFGENEHNDFASMEELKKAVEILVDELGGKITWIKDKK